MTNQQEPKIFQDIGAQLKKRLQALQDKARSIYTRYPKLTIGGVYRATGLLGFSPCCSPAYWSTSVF